MKEPSFGSGGGVKATEKNLPGIAAELRSALRQIREKKNDQLGVAAVVATEFSLEPSLRTFRELRNVTGLTESQGLVWVCLRQHEAMANQGILSSDQRGLQAVAPG